MDNKWHKAVNIELGNESLPPMGQKVVKIFFFLKFFWGVAFFYY